MHVRRVELFLPVLLLLVLLGCGGSNSPPGGGGGGDKTVSGQVLDGYGQPVQNRTVLIGPGSATTNASGQFTITGVATPYDLVIVESAPTKFATIYSQLTRTDPKVLDLGANAQFSHSATLGGNIDGGVALPPPAGTVTSVAFGSPEASYGAYIDSTPYGFAVPWSGPTTTTGTVHGLQWTIDQNYTVTGYLGHAVKSGVALTAGGTVSDADLALTLPSTDDISATITVPAGHEIVERDVFVGFDDGTYIWVSADGLDAGTLQVPLPAGIGASGLVSIQAATSDGSSLSSAQVSHVTPGTTGVQLSLPVPALATAPANGATGVDTTTDLIWTPLSGGIHILFLSGSASNPVYVIFSGGTRARIPDLSAHGLGLPSGQSYDFALVGIGPFTSLDAFAETGQVPREGFPLQTSTSSTFTTR